jgi:hypothetical protein
LNSFVGATSRKWATAWNSVSRLYKWTSRFVANRRMTVKSVFTRDEKRVKFFTPGSKRSLGTNKILLLIGKLTVNGVKIFTPAPIWFPRSKIGVKHVGQSRFLLLSLFFTLLTLGSRFASSLLLSIRDVCTWNSNNYLIWIGFLMENSRKSSGIKIYKRTDASELPISTQLYRHRLISSQKSLIFRSIFHRDKAIFEALSALFD